MTTSNDNFSKSIEGLKPIKKVTGTVLKIASNGEIKLFGLFTLRKGKKNEKDFKNLTGN